jgi:hypothetical protein
MDLTYDDSTCAFRDEVRAFLAANKASFPTKSYDTAEGFEQHRRWDRVLFDAGLSVITWPKKYGGRDATLLQWVVYEEEYFRAGAPGRASANGTSMLAPTLFAHGSEEQLDRVLPKMASGERSGPRRGRSRSPAAIWPPAVHRHPDRRRLAAQQAEDLVQPGAFRRPRLRVVPIRPHRRTTPPEADLLHVRPQGRRRDGSPDRPVGR